MTAKPYDLMSRMEQLVQLKRQPAIREEDEAAVIELAMREIEQQGKVIAMLQEASSEQERKLFDQSCFIDELRAFLKKCEQATTVHSNYQSACYVVRQICKDAWTRFEWRAGASKRPKRNLTFNKLIPPIG